MSRAPPTEKLPDASPQLSTSDAPQDVNHDTETQLVRTVSSAGPLYSAFTKRQRIYITFMASLGSFISPLSALIYFPALNALAAHYHVTSALINLTLTTYQIFQGLAPALYGDFADQAGRRPAFLVILTVYSAANIGLALQNSYAALMVLRCLQSTGSAGTVALSIGVIADVTTPSERGTYLGVAMAGTLIAPAIAPIIGGLLAQFLGWRSIFWFLVIFGGCYFTLYVITVPETNRKIVGNGSIKPRAWWNKSLMDVFKKHQTEQPPDASELPKLKWPRPWRVAYPIIEKDISILLFFIGMLCVAFYAVLATTPSQFKDIYGFNDLQIGLCYIPMGVGAFVSALLTGRLLDWNYRRVARAHGLPVDKKRGDDLRNYPIEKARLQVVLPAVIPGILSIICYGWVLRQRTNLAAPLILQLLNGLSMTGGMNAISTLLVDLYPQSPATITATSNLVRCLMSAGAVALVDPMIAGIGIGWTYVLIGLLCAASLPLLFVLQKKGPTWREERRVRFAERDKLKEERKQRLDKPSDKEEQPAR